VRTATAYTRPDGRFSFTTYVAGDGVEPGDYKITFDWFDVNQLGRPTAPQDAITKSSEKDKLAGRYSDPVKSEFNISVSPAQPQMDLRFNLSTQD
jgi:hypothetical protein